MLSSVRREGRAKLHRTRPSNISLPYFYGGRYGTAYGTFLPIHRQTRLKSKPPGSRWAIPDPLRTSPVCIALEAQRL